jgi:acyl carrier protein
MTMTDMFTTIEKVYAIVADVLEVPHDKLSRDCEFIADLGADQLDLLEIATLCKQAFRIDIPQKDLERLTTVGLLSDYVVYFIESERQAYDYD